MPASTSRRVRAPDQRLDALDQLIAGIDIDAGVAIGHAAAVCHGICAWVPSATACGQRCYRTVTLVVACDRRPIATGQCNRSCNPGARTPGAEPCGCRARAAAARWCARLYVVARCDVDGSPQPAAQDAMRQALVRLTGARDAAERSGARRSLIADARRYVQLQRAPPRPARRRCCSMPRRCARRSARRAAASGIRAADLLLWSHCRRCAPDATRAASRLLGRRRGARSADQPVRRRRTAAAMPLTLTDALLQAAQRAGPVRRCVAQPHRQRDPAQLQWTLVRAECRRATLERLGRRRAIDDAVDALVRSRAGTRWRARRRDCACQYRGRAGLAGLRELAERAAAECPGGAPRSTSARSTPTADAASEGARRGGRPRARAGGSDRLRARRGARTAQLEYRLSAAGL